MDTNNQSKNLSEDEIILNDYMDEVANKDNLDKNSLIGIKTFLNNTFKNLNLNFEEFMDGSNVIFETIYNKSTFRITYNPDHEFEDRYFLSQIETVWSEEQLYRWVTLDKIIDYINQPYKYIDFNVIKQKSLYLNKVKIREAVNTEVIGYIMSGNFYDLFMFKYHNSIYKFYYHYFTKKWIISKNNIYVEDEFDTLDGALDYVKKEN